MIFHILTAAHHSCHFYSTALNGRINTVFGQFLFQPFNILASVFTCVSKIDMRAMRFYSQ